MTGLPSDNALMVRVSRGDAEAFRALVQRYQQRVLTVATRFLGDRARAEEVTQEVFLRVFHAAPRYRTAANFSTWLFTIVRRCCFNATRTERREAARLTAAPATASPVDPEQQLLRRERRERIQSALLELPARQRLALVLHCFDGLTQAETAAVLGTTPRGVESCLYRAKRRLAALLEPSAGISAERGIEG